MISVPYFVCFAVSMISRSSLRVEVCSLGRYAYCVDILLPLSGSPVFFFLMIRRPPRSTLDRSSAASDVYKRQAERWRPGTVVLVGALLRHGFRGLLPGGVRRQDAADRALSLIHISEPTRPY